MSHLIKKIILIVAMSYQNPDYELKLSEAKARKILSHLKLKSAGRSRKEKAAAEGLVSKRKSEIDKKVAEVEAKKSEEIAKRQRTKTKVHPKPEPPKAPEPPKSLVIGDTMANIKAPAPYQEYGKQVYGKIGVAKEGLPLGFYTPGELKTIELRKKKSAEERSFEKYKARKAAGLEGFSDTEGFSDDD